jgi:hypothetical protein
MSLVLAMRKGEEFFVDQKGYRLAEINDGSVRLVRVEDNTSYGLTTDEGTELEDDVFARLGDRQTMKACRIAIDAPRSVSVLSGGLFRAHPRNRPRQSIGG